MKQCNQSDQNKNSDNRRNFLKKLFFPLISLAVPELLLATDEDKGKKVWRLGDDYNPYDHYWGMGIDITKCIGCGRCVEACKRENKMPLDSYMFRTWVERYRIKDDGEALVDSPDGAINGFDVVPFGKNIMRGFFVPKLCNQCDNPPCVQVCPVGATFKTPDGVTLVDAKYCIGCQYCIQGCPYGARFLNPTTRTAEKCTFCYHRLVRGKMPACVEVCPQQARIFGELKKKASPLARFLRMNHINVLKPNLNTNPKVFYANLDMEVR